MKDPYLVQNLFGISGLSIRWYAAIICLGLVAGLLVAYLMGRRRGYNFDMVLDLLLLALPICIIGARLYYVAFEWETYKNNPAEIFAIWHGGLAIYGAVIGGVIAAVVFCKWKKVPLGDVLDLGSLGLILGQAIGRWGNFANQEAFGNLITNPDLQFFPYGVYIDRLGEWHQATFFYESMWNLLVLAVLLWYFKRAKHKGNVFVAYLALYGVGRFFIEGLRTDSLWMIPGVIRVSQLLSAVLVVFGAAYLWYMHRRPAQNQAYYGIYSLGYKKPGQEEEPPQEQETPQEAEETAQDEAGAIIRDINRAHGKGLSYKDCAVLYRTNAQSRLLEEKCVQYNIPYRLIGGVNFYQRKEIKDILSYLKTVDNGRDDLAVQRIINIPKRGIGGTSIGKAMLYASANDMSFFEALTRADRIPGLGRAAERIAGFVRLIEAYRGKLAYKMSVSELIRDVLDTSGYDLELAKEDEAEEAARRENLEELINKAVDYEARAEEPSLGGFLEEVALVAEVDNLDPQEDRITLMTLHGAKGLEFTKVYLSGMEDGLFPGSMAVNSDDPGDLEEERLFYVGVTRAKKELTLTGARMRMVNGENRYSRRSRFVDEIPPDLLADGRSRQNGSSVKGAQAGGSTQAKGVSPAYKAPEFGGFGKLQGQGVFLGKQFHVTKAESLAYQAGDRVRHAKFGIGTVREITEQKRDFEVAVEFDNYGVKRMYASFARLEKI